MNPSPKSPAQVSKDPAYEEMTGYQSDGWWPSAAEVVVKHKETSTFWRAVYSVRDDDSDFGQPVQWRQVVPEQVTVTKYKPIG